MAATRGLVGWGRMARPRARDPRTRSTRVRLTDAEFAAFEETAQSYDRVVEVSGVRLLVDPTSLMYLEGATIDFVDSLMGGGFRIDIELFRCRRSTGRQQDASGHN